MAERNYLSIGQSSTFFEAHTPIFRTQKLDSQKMRGSLPLIVRLRDTVSTLREDVDRLEVILHLQKTRYMPLNVIKQRLENATDLSTLAYEVGLLSDVAEDGAQGD